MDFKDKICVVTGGTKGIGRATVDKLSSMGAKIYACARNEVKFDNDNIVFHKLDVTDINSCKELCDYIDKKDKKIDIIILDAGITSDALTKNLDEKEFDKVININLKGTFNVVKAFSEKLHMQKYGVIVTVGSIVGQYGNIGQVNYAASKAGIVAMTKSWAKEFARKGENIRVNCVSPGYTMTDMLKTVPSDLLDKFKNLTMLKRLGTPEEIANAICFLASDEASYITGTVLHVDGGMRL